MASTTALDLDKMSFPKAIWGRPMETSKRGFLTIVSMDQERVQTSIKDSAAAAGPLGPAQRVNLAHINNQVGRVPLSVRSSTMERSSKAKGGVDWERSGGLLLPASCLGICSG
jgi:hypothetical protein